MLKHNSAKLKQRLLSALALATFMAPMAQAQDLIHMGALPDDERVERPQQAEKSSTDVSYPRLVANAELGFLNVLSHSIQFSQNNSVIDYVKEGGQDTQFNALKLSLDLELAPNHTLVFLYQPLGLESNNVISRNLRIDNVDFAAGTPMRFGYDFPFFRGSYLYDFNPDPFEELAVGASLQIRDAVIEFEALDGSKLVSQRNIGPVPILKFRHRNWIGESRWWWASEVDGFYAPISILNGSTNEVIGAILDANLRVGVEISDMISPYLNLRYIAGGAVGTSSDPQTTGDGFNENWLQFLAVTVGMRTNLF